MNLILVFEQVIRLGILAWFDLRRGPMLAAMGIVFALHLLALAMCAEPVFPLWSALMVPLFEIRFGDLFLHYPQALIGLPTSGSGLRLLVDLVCGPLLALWVLRASLVTARGGELAGRRLGTVPARQYLTVFGYGVLVLGFWTLVHSQVLRLILGWGGLSYRLSILFTYLWGYVPTLLIVPAFFVLAILVDERVPLVSAFRRSAQRVREQPLICVVLAFLPHTLGIPFAYALNRSAILANQLRPEIVPLVMAVQSAVSIAVTYLLLNSSARLWVRRRRGNA